ncbi:MAG: hypothetical protein Q4G51_06680 [Dermatophilus congolensis]|nr:hypothetical protein [Dermatophilus congolensis]
MQVAGTHRRARALAAAALLAAISSCAVQDPAPLTHTAPSAPTAEDPIAARADVTYIARCDADSPESKPSSLVLDCENDIGTLQELSWQQWGEDKAVASGVMVMNDCYPDCETGSEERFPMTAVADQLVEGEAAATYRRLTVTVQDAGEDMGIQQVYHLPGIDPAGEAPTAS